MPQCAQSQEAAWPDSSLGPTMEDGPNVIEVHEVNEPKALKTVETAFDWSDLRIYDVNAPGLQHGVLLGTRRWP